MSERNEVNGFTGNSEILINELIEQQKQLQKTINDLISAVNSSTPKGDSLKNAMEQLINEKFKGLEKLMDNIKSVNQQEDANSLQAILKKGIIDLKLMTSTHHKGITKKFQILLFPEQDAKLFYKIVFGRWFMWLVIFVFLNFLYKWAIHRSDNDKQLMQDALKSNKEIKAWNYLYKESKKEVRKQMDSAWIKSADN